MGQLSQPSAKAERGFQPFNFDALQALARSNPAAFEAERRAMIKALITASGSSAQTLEKLQVELNAASDDKRSLTCLRLSEWLGGSYARLEEQVAKQRRQRGASAPTDKQSGQAFA